MRIFCIRTPIGKPNGFTLIELVLVIVLLGILSLGISSFLSMGSQIFVDVKNRSELTATARFAVERINREIRGALPNSFRVTYNNIGRQCIEFTPILTTAHYIDIPALPDDIAASNTIETVAFDDSVLSTTNTNYNVVVYPLLADDAYVTANNKKFTLNNTSIDKSTGTTNEWHLNFSNNVLFKENSPTSRLFFVDNSVSFCVNKNSLQLRRFVNGNPNNSAMNDSDGVLMADYIFIPQDNSGQVILSELPFRITESAQQRNSTVLIMLQLIKNEEIILFNNEIHIPNVP